MRKTRETGGPTRHPHPRKHLSYFRAKSVLKETPDAVLKRFEKDGAVEAGLEVMSAKLEKVI